MPKKQLYLSMDTYNCPVPSQDICITSMSMIMGVFQRPPYLPRGDALMTRDGDGKPGSPEYAIPMLLMAVIQGGWPTRKESVNIFDRVRIVQLSTRASETRGRVGELLFWLYEEDQDNNLQNLCKA